MHYDARFVSRETLRYSTFELIYTSNHANGGISTLIILLDLTSICKQNDYECLMLLLGQKTQINDTCQAIPIFWSSLIYTMKTDSTGYNINVLQQTAC